MNIELYEIVWGESTSELSEKVNVEIKFGWQPISGPSQAIATTLGKDRKIYIQAMVRIRE